MLDTHIVVYGRAYVQPLPAENIDLSYPRDYNSKCFLLTLMPITDACVILFRLVFHQSSKRGVLRDRHAGHLPHDQDAREAG